MKKNIKYIIGGLLVVLMMISFAFNKTKKKTVTSDNRLIAMNTNIPAYNIPSPVKEEAVVFKINKNTTDEDFLKIMEESKQKDIDIVFNNVNRNEDGIITNIEIVVSKGDLNKEFADANQNGIQPIIIKVTDTNIFVGYEFGQDDFFASSNGNTQDEMSQIQKMMQRQMQQLQQMQGSSNNNNLFAKFFGNDMMSDPDKMMQQMMQQMMQGDDAFFSNNSNGINNGQAKAKTNVKIEKHYIVNGKEMTEEEYQKMDKSKIRSLQVYQTQVVSKRYGL